MHQSQKGTAMSVAKMCDLAQHVASKVQFLHGRDLDCCNQVHGSVEAKTTVLVAIKWRSWSICQSQGELQGLPSLKHAASKDVVKHGSWIFATWSMSFEANKENTFWRAVQWHPWSMYLSQKKRWVLLTTLCTGIGWHAKGSSMQACQILSTTMLVSSCQQKRHVSSNQCVRSCIWVFAWIWECPFQTL